jgi:hypothetical protein
MTTILTDSAYIHCLACALDSASVPEIFKHQERLYKIASQLAAPVASPTDQVQEGAMAPVWIRPDPDHQGTWDKGPWEYSWTPRDTMFWRLYHTKPSAAPISDAANNERDAARYRWIRDCADPDDGQVHCSIHKQNDWGNWVNEWATGEALDEIVDADMAIRAALSHAAPL